MATSDEVRYECDQCYGEGVWRGWAFAKVIRCSKCNGTGRVPDRRKGERRESR